MDIQTKLLLILSLVICASGLATILLRRKAFWTLSGQITALKGGLLGIAAAAAFGKGGQLETLLLLLLISLVSILLLSAVGMAVIVRCQHFEGTLDYSRETELKN